MDYDLSQMEDGVIGDTFFPLPSTIVTPYDD